jgi:hypothetical protein
LCFFEKINKQQNGNSGLPTIAPTPLMATILVFVMGFIVVGGYIYNSKKHNKKK